MASVDHRPPVHYRPRDNLDPCGGPNNANDGCQTVFPRGEPGGKLCFFCVKLRDPSISSAERDEIRATYTQCGECGVCGTMISDPCGTCRRAENFENKVPDHERETSANRRRSNLENKLHRTDGSSVGTMVPLDELQTIRAAQGIGYASQKTQVTHCTVYYECRRSDSAKQIDLMLGTGVIFFPEVSTMLGLRSRIVKEVNGRWTEFHSAALLEEETSLRAPNNFVFPVDCLIMTVAQWYQVYNRPEYRDTYIVLPKQTQRKGKTNTKVYAFSVELYIHVGQYTTRTGDPELIGAGKAGSKRKASATDVADARASSQSSKRARETSSPQPPRQTLRSMFVADGDLLTQTLPTVPVAEIHFKKTTCLISEGTGSPTLLEESTLLSGFLEMKPLGLRAGERGNMKDIFGLRIGNQTYVAKKLVNIGSGRSDDIPLSKAVTILTADLIRVKRMAYFVEKFKVLAYDQGVDIAEFDVSEAFLVKSYKPSSPTASSTEHADGEPQEGSADVEPAQEVSAVYLVEPLRLTTAVVKFTGTLGSTNRHDLRSFTVTAFAHYVAEQTACRYIFADIQGSNNANVNGKLSVTLFDPMTHTPEGTSGIGDHGKQGLQDFVTNHVCSYICLNLQLASSEVLQNTLNDILIAEGEGTLRGDSEGSDED